MQPPPTHSSRRSWNHPQPTAPANFPHQCGAGASAAACMTSPTSRALPLLAPRTPAPLRALSFLGARPSQGAALHMAKPVPEEAADAILDEVLRRLFTLKATKGQISSQSPTDATSGR